MKNLLLWAGLTAAVWVVAAQTTAKPPAPEEDLGPSIKVDVELVNVLFSVRDRRGGLVPNLTKDDFTVYEDGKQQTIRSFTRETDLPLTIGLLVDVSGSQARLIEEERHAASRFFSSVLRPKDMAFLISFGSDAELLQDSTNSQKLLQEGLSHLKANSQVGGLHPGPVPTANRPRGTILYDAVYLAAAEKLRSEAGRKVMVLITDGMDQGSRYKLEEAIEAAHRADTIIYSIYYVDPGVYGFGYSDSALKRLSEQTGGRVFHVSRRMPLERIFEEIQSEVRSQYALGYSPTNPNRDGGFRKLEIKTKNSELKVQARKGYFTSKG